MWIFPQWAAKVPFSYWRRRFIRELMLEDEADRVSGPNSLNWRRLYYKTDSIQRGSHGLRNRKRILNIFKEIKADFEDP